MSGTDVELTINIGTGEDMAIHHIADIIASVVGFEGEIEWDRSKPDGTPRKVLNVHRANSLGWRHKIQLREGLERTYRETFG